MKKYAKIVLIATAVIVGFNVFRADGSSELVTHVTDSEFAEKIEGAQGLVAVDFYATWCGPCKVLAPVLDELAKDYEGQVQVYKLDVDKNRKSASKYGVRGIPFVVLFKDGVVVESVTGLRKKTFYSKLFDTHLPANAEVSE